MHNSGSLDVMDWSHIRLVMTTAKLWTCLVQQRVARNHDKNMHV